VSFASLTRRAALAATALATLAAFSGPAAADWRDEFDQIRLGTAASEVDDDTLNALEGLAGYLTDRLGIEVVIRQATDYAAVTEALRAGNLEFTRMGGANYALARRIMGDRVEPLVLDVVNGGRGYSSVVLVPSDSAAESIEDLDGASFAFVDPNSTSGYAAPNFFLSQAGIDPEAHFGEINDQFDAAATYEFTPDNSAVSRLAEREMIEGDEVRKIWTSPLMANPLWVGRTDLPDDLTEAFVTALLEVEQDAPEVWEVLRQGRLSGYARTAHEEYVPIIEMTEWNRAQRRGE
jgi:phosphonate transport system substrate-binding protein